MLLKLFKGNQPPTLFLIIIAGLLLWLPSMIMPSVTILPFEEFPTLLQIIFTGWISDHPHLQVILSFVLIVLLGLAVNWLNGKYFFIHERSFLPVLFVVFISSTIPEIHKCFVVVLSSFFMVLALDRIFITYGQNRISFNYFEAALLLSIASLLYFNIIIFFFILWISIIILRPFHWREWITPLFGLLIPYMFLFASYYLIYGEIAGLLVQYRMYFSHPAVSFSFQLPVLVWLGLLGLLIILASYHMILKFTTKKVSSRRFLLIVFWVFLLTLAGYFILPLASVELLYILSVSVTYLFTTYFLFQKPSWYVEMVFTVLFLCLCALRVLYVIG